MRPRRKETISRKKRSMGRRQFVQFLSVLSAGGTVFGNTVLLMAQEEKRITKAMLIEAEKVAGMRFSDTQRALLIPNLQSYLLNMQRIRQMGLPPEDAPALQLLSEDVWRLNRNKPRES